MNINDTLILQDELMKRYCLNQTDEEIIKALCFARNVAEKVEYHYLNTNSRIEFYKAILNDSSLATQRSTVVLAKNYSNLKI